MARIPFNRPYATGKEFMYIRDSIDMMHLSAGGPFTKKCQELLESVLGVHSVMLATSCTHALEMAALLLDIQPGDEVIVPSFSFVTTANSFVLRGAKPVFIDIRPDTLNMDESLLEGLITPRTKAIVPVHYAGVGCEMDAIMEVAGRHAIPVVEDNAHGLFGSYKGRFLGTFGCLAALSFHETKNLTCGEGGALIVNDPEFAERADIIRQKGTNRTKFFRGEVDKYTWVDLGSSYMPSEVLAAYLYAQLEARDDIQRRRRRIWEYYRENLAAWAELHGVTLPTVPKHCQQAYHMFYMLLPNIEKRREFIAHLRDRDIISVFHYVPLHLSPMGRGFGGKEGNCPRTVEVSDRLVRLPFFNDLTEEDQATVVQGIHDLPW
jgi:dTDP-4-amino-4,6-dideoxygalactose transaminase